MNGCSRSPKAERFSSIHEVAARGLCTGCGTCEAVCGRRAVTLMAHASRGVYLPVVNPNVCARCGTCVRACPGLGVDFSGQAAEHLTSGRNDDRIGIFETCYIGWSRSHTIRFNSSSGGVATSLLVYALQQGLVDAALVVKMSEANPLETEPFLARTSAEVLAASGSKYCPSPVNRGLRWIMESEGRFALVGLPCHIHAIRKLELIRPELQSKIVLRLGLFCANSNTYLGTEYFLRHHGIRPDDVRQIRYRGEGWPGAIKVTLSTGETRVIPRATAEPSWHRRVIFTSAFHYDFIIPRCLLCVDQTCELADVSLGDPWLRKHTEADPIGRSFVIARTGIGHRLLQGASCAGEIHLEEMNLDDAREAQNYAFKRNAGARIWVRRALGGGVPDYGRRRLPVTVAGVLSAWRYGPSHISFIRWSWPYIKVLALVHGLSVVSWRRLRAAVVRILNAPRSSARESP